MDRPHTHPDNDAVALLARALTPIFAAAMARAANEPAAHDAAAASPVGDDDLPRAA